MTTKLSKAQHAIMRHVLKSGRAEYDGRYRNALYTLAAVDLLNVSSAHSHRSTKGGHVGVRYIVTPKSGASRRRLAS